jgi:hypothetical protein
MASVKLSKPLKGMFDNEESNDHPYARLLAIAKNPLTPLAFQIEALTVLIKYRMPTLSAQLVQVDDAREKPVGRLEILSLLTNSQADPRTMAQLREAILQEAAQKQLQAATEVQCDDQNLE